MAIEPDLPVFSFRVNWKEPISERVSFLTDVRRAAQGAEQRASIRQTPRRSYEGDFLLSGPERTFFDLFINRLGGGEVYVPIPWEVTATGAGLTAGVSNRINFDTTFREWPYLIGEYAILMGAGALDYEIVLIDDVDATGIDLSAAVARAWPRGTKLLPLRRAVIDDLGDPSHKAAGVATVTAQFRFLGANHWTPAEDASPVYAGLPVFLDEPNWVEDLTVQLSREIDVMDTGVGVTYQVDTLGRVLLGQSHRWYLPGRERLAGFRDLLYRHRGRAGSFWLPTFKADFRLVNSPGALATQIEVENVGYLYTGGPTSGREYIAIKHSAGTILRKVLSVIPGATTATEKLVLDAALGLALSPGQVRRISFADTGRFDSDDFEIVHYGGADAHHDSSAMFRTFKNTRTSPEPISLPIPTEPMNSTACGYPGFSGLSWLLPCTSGGSVCGCVDPAPQTYGVGGLTGTTYNLNLRIRGVAETSVYSGGSAYGSSGRVIKDATSHFPGAHNVYVLHVSDPPASYSLNHGSGAESVIPLDYDVTIPIKGGATVTLEARSEGGTQIANTGSVSAPDDDPLFPIIVAQPYNGQFMQLDGSADI